MASCEGGGGVAGQARKRIDRRKKGTRLRLKIAKQEAAKAARAARRGVVEEASSGGGADAAPPEAEARRAPPRRAVPRFKMPRDIWKSVAWCAPLPAPLPRAARAMTRACARGRWAEPEHMALRAARLGVAEVGLRPRATASPAPDRRAGCCRSAHRARARRQELLHGLPGPFTIVDARRQARAAPSRAHPPTSAVQR